MDKVITGGCACGEVYYEINSKPDFSIICQCRDCQRNTGSGHSAAFAVKKELTKLKGNIKYYERKSDDGNIVRSGFCTNCGNPILNMPEMLPEFYMFHAATLDDPSMFKPEMVVYSESKQPWDFVNPTISKK